MDQQSSQRRLSEISHLFLSEVRAKTTGNAPLPQRRPPGAFRGDVSVDLTPEEFAEVFAENDDPDTGIDATPITSSAFKPVRAVVAHHLGELMHDRIRDLAGMLSQGGKRIGLIYADAVNVRVTRIEHQRHAQALDDDTLPGSMDARQLQETLVELDQDVDEWLIALPDPRQNESRELLKQISHWTLISGVDHDTIVASYRTIKGLCEGANPTLSIAIFGAVDAYEIDKTYRKLSSVCDQFLHMTASLMGAIEPADDLAEHLVTYVATSESSSESCHWNILGQMTSAPTPRDPPLAVPLAEASTLRAVCETEKNAPQNASPLSPQDKPSRLEPILPIAAVEDDTIVDLTDRDGSVGSIIAAVVQGSDDLIETPIQAPACTDAAVAVSPDHRLVLVAVAGSGLSGLGRIASAYRWMNENRQLIAMALPQCSIDTHARAKLELLVDHADSDAQHLQPLLESGFVTVRAYRKLRWAGKTGLLLEAA